jgi:ABC-type nitrate/sulfonate/bicarbonate transport system ATPase subunit
MTAPKLALRNISKSFHSNGLEVLALKDLSLQVADGEFLTLVGPSGSGKSTLLNLIVGLLEPDNGEILLDGSARRSRRGRFGYMPQRDLLLPWRSVIDNVILPQELANVPRQQAYEKARQLLPLFGLQGFEAAYPWALSGGMRQRAALLRTFLSEKDVLLLDEPFGALDALTRRELQDWLLDLWGRFGQTVVFITHDIEEALYLGDRVVVLSPRPGQVDYQMAVNLPRPRKPEMLASRDFRALLAELLSALEGVRVK